VNPNVTKKTSYLIVGNNPSSGKLQSAKEYSIPIIQMGDVFDISKLESL
jgi:NAD-dependent DNA ligase